MKVKFEVNSVRYKKQTRTLLIVRDVTTKVGQDYLDRIVSRMKRIYGSVTHNLLNPYKSIIVTAERLLKEDLDENERI